MAIARIGVALLLVGLAAGAPAQQYDAPWATFDNGATVEATSDNYHLMANIGEWCTGELTEPAPGEYAVAGGFWTCVWYAEAPSGYLGIRWSWIATPISPMYPDPQLVLGYDCRGALWTWDKYGKTTVVYHPPWLRWDLDVAASYLAYNEVTRPAVYFNGFCAPGDFEFKMGRMGWSWLSIPSLLELGYPVFMEAVQVEYPTGSGHYRTAAQDRAAGNPWVSWGWSFWDTQLQCAKTFTPYLPFGYNVCVPWVGYRAYVNVGSATNENDPDQVTLTWP
jgi:hypothetical protein